MKELFNMFFIKEIILERDKVIFTKEKLIYSLFENEKYERLIRGWVKIIIKDQIMAITRMEALKEPSRKALEKIINKNFFISQDKLFHHIFDKTNKLLIIYSVEKPALLDKIVENATVKHVIPYEVFLVNKYKKKIKGNNGIIFYISKGKLMVLGLFNKNLVFTRKYTEIKIESFKTALREYKKENLIDKNFSVIFEGETNMISSNSINQLNEELR